MSQSHTPIPAVIYAAFSTARGDASIEQQLADCRTMAQREGWTVLAEHSDKGKSAFTGSRGDGLEAAMAASEAAAPCVLVVRDSTRLARGDAVGTDGARSLIEVATWATRKRVTLRSVRDDHYFASPLLVAVADMLAHGESKAKSERAKSGVKRRKAEGKHLGGRIYGYRSTKGLLVEHQSEADVVRRIFKELGEGISQASLARTLNAELEATGSPTPLRAARWNQGSISSMVRRQTYLGRIPTATTEKRGNVADDWQEGAHEAIVTQEEWDAAHSAIRSRLVNPGRGGGTQPKGGHLLTGRLLRHSCGEPMTPRTHARKDGVTLRYQCAGRKAGVCEGLVVDARIVDDAIARFLADVGVDADASFKAAQAAVEQASETHAAQVAHATKVKADAERSLERIRGDYIAGTITAEDWKSIRDELAGKAADAEATLGSLEQEPPPTAQEVVSETVDALAVVRSALAAGEVERVRAALGRLFESFTIERFNPDDYEAEHPIELADMLPGPYDDPSADDVLSAGDLLLIPEPRKEALSGVVTDQGGRLLDRFSLPVTANYSGLLYALVITLSTPIPIRAPAPRKFSPAPPTPCAAAGILDCGGSCSFP